MACYSSNSSNVSNTSFRMLLFGFFTLSPLLRVLYEFFTSSLQCKVYIEFFTSSSHRILRISVSRSHCASWSPKRLISLVDELFLVSLSGALSSSDLTKRFGNAGANGANTVHLVVDRQRFDHHTVQALQMQQSQCFE